MVPPAMLPLAELHTSCVDPIDLVGIQRALWVAILSLLDVEAHRHPALPRRDDRIGVPPIPQAEHDHIDTHRLRVVPRDGPGAEIAERGEVQCAADRYTGYARVNGPDTFA